MTSAQQGTARPAPRGGVRSPWPWLVSAALHASLLVGLAFALPAERSSGPDEQVVARISFHDDDALPMEVVEIPDPRRQRFEPDLEPVPFLEPPDVELPPVTVDEPPVEEDWTPPLEEDAPPEPATPRSTFDVPLGAVKPRPRPPSRPAPPAPPRPVVAATPAPRRPARPPVARTATPRTAPVRTTLRVVRAPDPRHFYPAQALEAGWQGVTLVRIVVDAAGRVVETAVERSAGNALLDAAALALARAYQFNAAPGLRRARLPVTFRMAAGTRHY